MSAESIVRQLLAVAGITNLVGDRVADTQLPDGTRPPALVYEVISSVPEYPIGAAGAPQLMRSRVQMSALTATALAADTLQAAVHTAMNLKSGVLGGVQVSSVIRDFIGPKDRDASGVWLKAVDYILLHWEVN